MKFIEKSHTALVKIPAIITAVFAYFNFDTCNYAIDCGSRLFQIIKIVVFAIVILIILFYDKFYKKIKQHFLKLRDSSNNDNLFPTTPYPISEIHPFFIREKKITKSYSINNEDKLMLDLNVTLNCQIEVGNTTLDRFEIAMPKEDCNRNYDLDQIENNYSITVISNDTKLLLLEEKKFIQANKNDINDIKKDEQKRGFRIKLKDDLTKNSIFNVQIDYTYKKILFLRQMNNNTGSTQIRTLVPCELGMRNLEIQYIFNIDDYEPNISFNVLKNREILQTKEFEFEPEKKRLQLEECFISPEKKLSVNQPYYGFNYNLYWEQA